MYPGMFVVSFGFGSWSLFFKRKKSATLRTIHNVFLNLLFHWSLIVIGVSIPVAAMELCVVPRTRMDASLSISGQIMTLWNHKSVKPAARIRPGTPFLLRAPR
jgi:uncharacterized membrane protein